MKKCLAALFLAALVVTALVWSASRELAAESLWRDSHLFTTRVEIRAGDILKIHFAYRNLVRYRSEMKVGEDESVSFAQPNVAAFSFLPSFENSATYTRNNNLEYNNEREFSTSLAVSVESVNENGIVRFRGGHTVVLNGQSEQVILQGDVRQLDIGEGNTVSSTDIANLSFIWHGPMVVRQRSLGADDFITPTGEDADADAPASGELELTPEARQRLLLQYLNRVHDLLFRE